MLLELYNNGVGLIPLDYLVTFFVFFAAFMFGAVLKDPNIVESSMQMVGRRIVLGGLCMFAARYVYLLLKYGDVILPPISEIALLVVLIGLTVMSVDKIFPQLNEITEKQAQAMIASHEREIVRLNISIEKKKTHTQRKTDPQPAQGFTTPPPQTRVTEMPLRIEVVDDKEDKKQ